MKNKLSKMFPGLLGTFIISLVFVFPLIAQAAVDSVLTGVTASTTAYLNDNKSTIVGFYVTIGLIGLGISVAVGLLLKGFQWIKAALFGGGRKR